jgi:hypothetical protein
MATSTNRRQLSGGAQFDRLAKGKYADLLVFDGDPLKAIEQLEEKHRIIDVWKAGARVELPDMPVDMPRHPSETSQGYWNRLYTRKSTRHTAHLSPEHYCHDLLEQVEALEEDGA